MKSKKNLWIAVLLVLLGASGVVAFRLYREVVRLKGAAMAADTDLRKRVAELEKQNRRLADELAARPDQAAADQGGPTAAGGRRGGGGRFGGGFRQMLDNPQFQKLVAIQDKARLDSRYASLFRNLVRNLNLTPEQLDQFKNLLVQRQQAAMDAASAAFQQGLNPRDDRQAFQQAISDAQATVDQQIQAQLGSSGYAMYQQYEQTLPERSTVEQVQQALSYTSTPLSDDQANQLVQILQQSAPQGGGNPGGMRGFFNGGGPGTQVTSQALTLAQGVLSAPQLQALQQVQQQQQAQQQMMQLIRAGRQGGNAAQASNAAGR